MQGNRGVNLFEAFNQYTARPQDERFGSTRELHEVVTNLQLRSIESKVDPRELLIGYTDGDNAQLVIQGKEGIPARLTHRAQKHLLSMSLPGAGTITDLVPVDLAAQCIQAGLKRRGDAELQNKLLLLKPKHADGMLTCRAFIGPDYARIWHADITSRMLQLEEEFGWMTPPARATSGDDPRNRTFTVEDKARWGSATNVEAGELIGPAGTYFGQGIPELFMFRVNVDHAIDGAGEGKNRRTLNRFLMASNSETGDASFRLRGGLYDFTCGNHIIWGAQDIWEARIRHAGRAAERADQELRLKLEAYANEDMREDELRVKKAMEFTIGQDKKEVLDRLFGLKVATRKVLDAAWETVDQKVLSYGSPTTAWGMACGIQEVSQQEDFVDARVKLDEAASKVLQLAF